jgi:DNA-binding IclR family transcriptional regulator
VVTPRALATDLRHVREAGWSAEIEELTPGEAAVAAPIRGQGGLVVGAIGISGHVERICDTHYLPRQRLVAYVRDAARAVSRELGTQHV